MNATKPALLRTAVALSVFSLLLTGCKKESTQSTGAATPAADLQGRQDEHPKKIGHYNEVNLVANTTGYNAAHIDPTLINAWGIAFSPGGTAWVNAQGGHVSDVYDGEGNPVAVGPVNIPGPVAPTGGNPTGIVFNGTPQFVLPTGGPARFIFVGVDGVVSGWNGAQGHQAFRKLTVPASAFTGLTMGVNNGMNLLYAANFRANRINVWDGNWNPVNLPFMDPNIPAGYAPFNIQNIGGMLYVTYAKVGTNGRSEEGLGKGFVDIYRTDGTLIRRFASQGTLNAPWGLTMAPASFFKHDDDDGDDDNDMSGHNVILVGNFGDGRINAFRDDGKPLGQLRGMHGQLVEIEGLWAIVFPPTTSPLDPNRLYFAAGPDEETHGLFGYLIPKESDGD
jgi:uncharacterized protein (TIGR03118 family)